MDGPETSDIQFTASKDTPVQRTRITTDKIISQTLLPSSLEPSDEPPSTSTTIERIIVSNSSNNFNPTAIVSNVKSIVDGAPWLTNPSSPWQSPSTSASASASTPASTPTSATPSAPPSAIASRRKGSPSGAIAGIIIGVLAALSIIGFLVWWFLRKRARSDKQDELQNHTLNQQRSTFRLMSQPPPVELEHSSPHLPRPGPVHQFATSTPEDSRLSAYGETQMSTPRPAVAEVKSYTRAGHKPRVYDVGGPISELPADNGAPHAISESFKMVPMSRAGDASIVSPVSPGPRARPTLPWDDSDMSWTTRRGGSH